MCSHMMPTCARLSLEVGPLLSIVIFIKSETILTSFLTRRLQADVLNWGSLQLLVA